MPKNITTAHLHRETQKKPRQRCVKKTNGNGQDKKTDATTDPETEHREIPSVTCLPTGRREGGRP